MSHGRRGALAREMGATVIMALALVAAGAALGLAALGLVGASQVASVRVGEGYSVYYAAVSGLEWVAQTADGFTTSDKSRWLSVDNSTVVIGDTGFKISITYSDPDNSPFTADTAIVVSTGFAGDPAFSSSIRVLTTMINVPAPGRTAVFSDHYDQLDASFFDGSYQFGQAAGYHGDMTPYRSANQGAGGDNDGLFTLSHEQGGSASLLKMGGSGEVRYFIAPESCLKWRTSPFGDPCSYPECANSADCQARQGMDLAQDMDGYHNYFIKVRAKLVSGAGFGVYFRATYPNQNDPSTIDFGGLTGYVFQYDSGMGYIAPCDLSTAILGSDGSGVMFTRKISGGTEICPAECGIFSAVNPPPPSDSYPFFCPENRTGRPYLDGWRWTNADWAGNWRTIYIYVYRNVADIYVDREQAGGPGIESVGSVRLNGVGSELKTGGVGLRVWDNSQAFIDYIRVYPNDDNKTPATFTGDP